MLFRGLLIIGLMLASLSAFSENAIRLEAESGKLTGTTPATNRPGYSGEGYITGFDAAGDKAVLQLQAKAGLYEMRVRYSAPYGEKGFEITVNGHTTSGMLPGTGDTFATHPAGKVQLIAGLNAIEIAKGWGWYDVDYIEFVPVAASPKLKKPAKTLVDPKATTAAKALISYLIDNYGSRMLSGQYDQYDGKEIGYIREITAKTPAILGGDLMDYSPSRIARGANAKDHVEQMIKSARDGHIITMCWHWNAPKDLLDTPQQPWYKGFYTAATTFDLRRALDNPDSEDYKLLVRDMDTIALQLKKFADADVPVLWRPLHEAEGGWFWWGAKGPEAYIKLWRLMFDRFTKHHALHNLIWVHNCVKPDWYPGDAYVDIVGVDAYPSDPTDPLSGTWDDLIKRFDGKKLLAVTEFGGVPDAKRMFEFGARWSFFTSWAGTFGPHKMTKQDLLRIYKDPLVINRDDLRIQASKGKSGSR